MSGCLFYPRKVRVYDKDCKVETHELALDMADASHVDCSNGDPRACLIGIAAIGPVSMVVSGSIVVVGNTLIWMERKGECALVKH